MRSKKSRSISYHLVTPEEPSKIKRRHDKNKSDDESSNNNDNSADLSRHGLNSAAAPETDTNFIMPSLRNTRELETEILDAIQALKQRSNDNAHIISLLNRSITAISHWSLQAQLVQLRSNVDDRQIVETNLLRKEMELLINRRSSTEDKGNIKDNGRKKEKQPRTLTKGGYLRSPPYHPSTASNPSSPKRSVRKHLMLSSPTSNTLDDPVSLKLVENNKPHPRMKRNSDNPSTNEYVRVFHLQRE